MSARAWIPLLMTAAGCNAVLGNDPRELDPSVAGGEDPPSTVVDAGNTAIEQPDSSDHPDVNSPVQDPNASVDAQGPAVIGDDASTQEPTTPEQADASPPADDPPPAGDPPAEDPAEEPGGKGKNKKK